MKVKWARPFNGSMRNKQCIDYYFSVLILCHLLDTKLWIIDNFSNKQPWMKSYYLCACSFYLWKKKHNCQITNDHNKNRNCQKYQIDLMCVNMKTPCSLLHETIFHLNQLYDLLDTNDMVISYIILVIWVFQYLQNNIYHKFELYIKERKTIPKHLW